MSFKSVYIYIYTAQATAFLQNQTLVTLTVRRVQREPEFSLVKTFCTARAILHIDLGMLGGQSEQTKETDRQTDRHNENIDRNNTAPFRLSAHKLDKHEY
jgi:hypothetical protein